MLQINVSVKKKDNEFKQLFLHIETIQKYLAV